MPKKKGMTESNLSRSENSISRWSLRLKNRIILSECMDSDSKEYCKSSSSNQTRNGLRNTQRSPIKVNETPKKQRQVLNTTKGINSGEAFRKQQTHSSNSHIRDKENFELSPLEKTKLFSPRITRSVSKLNGLHKNEPNSLRRSPRTGNKKALSTADCSKYGKMNCVWCMSPVTKRKLKKNETAIKSKKILSKNLFSHNKMGKKLSCKIVEKEKNSLDISKLSDWSIEVEKTNKGININSPIVSPKMNPENNLESEKLNHSFKNFDKVSLVSFGEKSETEVSSKKRSENSVKHFCENIDATDGFKPPKLGKKNSKNRLLLRKSDSFEKYGVILPSYDEILGNINKIKDEAKALDAYEGMYENLNDSFSLSDNLTCDISPQKSLQLLDCKSLNREEMKTYFNNNLEYIKNVFDSIMHSERHKRYKNYDPFTLKDLSYNVSTIVYTDDQIDHLLTLLEKNLDPDDQYGQYFFKVLLPKLCLKIFADVHSMSIEEASKYLDWRPVD